MPAAWVRVPLRLRIANATSYGIFFELNVEDYAVAKRL
jgi:hypothetical protein